MQYRTGTVSVINGSPVVTGSGTAWLSASLEAGFTFKKVGQNVIYEIASIDSNTQITLSSNYAGINESGVSYVITRDYTDYLGLPEICAGDIDWPYTLTRALRMIDSSLALIGTEVAAMTTATDPLANAAVTTAIVDAYSGIIVTLTAPGNAQVLQAPTDVRAGKEFTVVNKATSTNTLSVDGLVVEAGWAQKFIWSGATWIPVTSVDAKDITFTPYGGLASISVQAAIQELDDEKAPKASPVFTTQITTPIVQLEAGGPKIKNSAGTVQIRNAADNAYAPLAVSSLTASLAQNTATLITIENTNAGDGATAGIKFTSDGGSAQIYRTSAAYGVGIADDFVFQDQGGGDFVFFNSTTELMRLTNAGNFGFNTTDIEAWHTNYHAMQLGTHDAIMWGAASDNLFLIGNAYYDGASLFKYRTAAAAAAYNVSGVGGHYFYVAPAGSADAAITWSIPMQIKSTGVEINSYTNASYGLQVVGSAGGAREIFLAGQSGFSNGFTVDYTGTAMEYKFMSGNVGIGCSPVSKLQLYSDASNWLSFYVAAGDGDGPAIAFDSSLGLRIGTYSDISMANWSEKVRITGGGNVGICTSAPATLLEVYGGSDTSNILWSSSIRNNGNGNATGYGAGLKLKISNEQTNEANKWGGIAAVAGAAYANSVDLVFYTTSNVEAAPVECMRLTGSGRLKLGASTLAQYTISLPAGGSIGYYEDVNHYAIIDIYNVSTGYMNFTSGYSSGGFTFNVLGSKKAEINSSGHFWVEGNGSFESITDRTPHPGNNYDALTEIMKIKGRDNKIDHSTLPEFARKTIKNGEIEEEGRDLGAMISIHDIAFQQAYAEITELKKRIAELEKQLQ